MRKQTQLRIKRVIDVVGAGVALTAASPLMLGVAALIPRLLGTGGVFFVHRRPGFREEPFNLIKFRSMIEAFDDQDLALPEGDRMTKFGWWLRKYSIDELPELLNVLKGEMSLVGPRPLLMEYLSVYPPEYRRRHDVMPGITGWAQVNGRHHATFRERLEMDVWYVENWSLWLDLRILWMTVGEVLGSRHVEPPDQARSDVDDLDLHSAVSRRARAKRAGWE